MSLLKAAGWFLRWLAPESHAEDVLGDLEEAHGRRRQRRGRAAASLLTTLECLDMARALIIGRIRSNRPRNAGPLPSCYTTSGMTRGASRLLMISTRR